ncbi:tetratricopeptide repeat protein [Streptomyces sp. NPDC005931]|uniref:tetratricopeptide repeat protein n=1 Tax=Streptomyces sp. NPDC005931 TaxID=3364737 RepID=UPI0036ADB20D
MEVEHSTTCLRCRRRRRSRVDTTYYGHGTPAERWERAGMFFDAEDYAAAARVLGPLVDEVPEQTGPRLLLARAYSHSAQLRRAEAELRVIVERDPVEHYAWLMLGRTLRQERHEEAASHLRIASAPARDFESWTVLADGPDRP